MDSNADEFFRAMQLRSQYKSLSEPNISRDGHNSVIGDRQPPRQIFGGIDADADSVRDLHALVNDRPIDPTVATDVDAVEQNRFSHGRVAVNSYPR